MTLLGFSAPRISSVSDQRERGDQVTHQRTDLNLLGTTSEEPNSKRLRYAVSGVALIILVSFGIWFFFLRFISEKHTVEHFMDAVVAQDYQRAFQIWKAHGSYTYQ